MMENTKYPNDKNTGDPENLSQVPQADSPVETGSQEETSFEKKYQELNDKYLRLHAEFDNYRKRSIRERIEVIQNASEHLIIELLAIADDFDRAISSFDTTTDILALKEGVSLIQSKFKKILESKGLKEIKTTDEPFDVDFHEAVAYIPTDSDEKKNKVIDVVQKGYLLNEKVIRFAKVVVGS